MRAVSDQQSSKILCDTVQSRYIIQNEDDLKQASELVPTLYKACG